MYLNVIKQINYFLQEYPYFYIQPVNIIKVIEHGPSFMFYDTKFRRNFTSCVIERYIKDDVTISNKCFILFRELELDVTVSTILQNNSIKQTSTMTRYMVCNIFKTEKQLLKFKIKNG